MSHETLGQEQYAEYAERILATATLEMTNFIPSLVPKEPAKIVIEPLEYFMGGYLGKLRGIHYLFFQTIRFSLWFGDDSFRNKMAEVNDTVTLLHERIHQWQAELDPSIYGDKDEQISDRQLGDMRAEDLLYEMWLSESRRDHPTLTQVLTEGFATFISLATINRMLVSEQTDGDSQKAWILGIVRRRIIGQLRGGKKEFWGISPHSSGVFGYIHPLYKKLGLLGLVDFMKRIDYAACNEILSDSDEYKRYLEGPMLLPLATGRSR